MNIKQLEHLYGEHALVKGPTGQYHPDIQASIAISLKRIADALEKPQIETKSIHNIIQEALLKR